MTEVLRYLGRRGQAVPPELERQVRECMAQMRETATVRHIWRDFPHTAAEDGLQLEGTVLVLRGGDIRRHLSGCERTVLLATTPGPGRMLSSERGSARI